MPDDELSDRPSFVTASMVSANNRIEWNAIDEE